MKNCMYCICIVYVTIIFHIYDIQGMKHILTCYIINNHVHVYFVTNRLLFQHLLTVNIYLVVLLTFLFNKLGPVMFVI